MNKPKASKTGRDEPIADPQIIKRCLTELHSEATEFPIKVEGTSTLPYASQIVALHWEPRQLVLKLVRPLPHELAPGAVFRMTFAAEGQRYESLITFAAREAYLQYRFALPESFFHSERRRERRFPFRPRESAYIIAQSGVLTGYGAAGPLVNISMGGLALRVDRLIRLEDKMRIPINSGVLDTGRVFDRIRLQDLPRLPLLELWGRVAHATPKGDELILGLEFGGMSEEDARNLHECLSFREKISKGSSFPVRRTEGTAKKPARGSTPEDDGSGDLDEMEEAPELEETTSPLRILQRRTTRIGLIMAPKEPRAGLLDLLDRYGYTRVEIARDLGQAKALWGGSGRPRMLLVDLSPSGPSPQAIETWLKTLGSTPGILLSDASDPSMMMGLDGSNRTLPLRPASEEDEEHWIRTVDLLAGLEA